MPKSERKKLILANDRLVREIVLRRDNYTCQWSGKKGNLQVAHFFSRSNLRLRWELDNLITLNAGVHLWRAHKYPEEFREFFIGRIGKKRFEELNLKMRYKAPVRMDDLLGWHYKLKQELLKLNETSANIAEKLGEGK